MENHPNVKPSVRNSAVSLRRRQVRTFLEGFRPPKRKRKSLPTYPGKALTKIFHRESVFEIVPIIQDYHLCVLKTIHLVAVFEKLRENFVVVLQTLF
jgi:hypothetical protein